jgi:hypothetical protein
MAKDPVMFSSASSRALPVLAPAIGEDTLLIRYCPRHHMVYKPTIHLWQAVPADFITALLDLLQVDLTIAVVERKCPHCSCERPALEQAHGPIADSRASL